MPSKLTSKLVYYCTTVCNRLNVAKSLHSITVITQHLEIA